MQVKFNLYPKAMLPNNFSYPNGYIKLSKDLSIINQLEYFPWWFENHRDSIIQH